jgi:hypothetical protein
MLDPIITLYLLGQFQEGGGVVSIVRAFREGGPNVRFADRIEVGTRDAQYPGRKRGNIFASELYNKNALQYQWPNFGAESLIFAH